MPGSTQVSMRTSLGKFDVSELAGARLEIGARIFGVKANFDGVPARIDGEGVERSKIPRRLENHPLNQVDAGDFFGDAMLDLQARVDFKKEEVAGEHCRRRTPRCRLSDS